MAEDEIHVGDTGTVITVSYYDGATAVDVSGATPATSPIVFKAPDGTATSVVPSLGPASHQMHYHSLSTTWDQAGEWSVQGYVTIGSDIWHSDVQRFTVYPNLT